MNKINPNASIVFSVVIVISMLTIFVLFGMNLKYSQRVQRVESSEGLSINTYNLIVAQITGIK